MSSVYPCIINGERVQAGVYGVFEDRNPADVDEVVAVFPLLSREDVKKAIDSAEEAFEKWAALSPVQRG
ncbi:MAG: aldehyde dehydrogenase family protein, partial [Aigarchaeota archaeon]|nr:aldehyde dehydrogenase family protein [Candidatus Caldarchaeales archaeon]